MLCLPELMALKEKAALARPALVGRMVGQKGSWPWSHLPPDNRTHEPMSSVLVGEAAAGEIQLRKSRDKHQDRELIQPLLPAHEYGWYLTELLS